MKAKAMEKEKENTIKASSKLISPFAAAQLEFVQGPKHSPCPPLPRQLEQRCRNGCFRKFPSFGISPVLVVSKQFPRIFTILTSNSPNGPHRLAIVPFWR